MADITGVNAVKAELRKIYARKYAAIRALCERYAAEAELLFNSAQNDDYFWENQTMQAKDSVFSGTFEKNNMVGFFLAHGKDYGVYLELKDNRKHESLRPVIAGLVPQFMKDLKEIWT